MTSHAGPSNARAASREASPSLPPRVVGLEVDLLGGLMQLRDRPEDARPRFVLIPGPSEGDEVALRARAMTLLTREARRFHELEQEVATRRAAALHAEARVLGHEAGAAWARDAAEAAQRDAEFHRAALHEIEDRAADALQGLWVAPLSREVELVAAEGASAVVRLYDDGYALEESPEARLAARRAFLGLPEGDDWRTGAAGRSPGSSAQ